LAEGRPALARLEVLIGSALMLSLIPMPTTKLRRTRVRGLLRLVPLGLGLGLALAGPAAAAPEIVLSDEDEDTETGGGEVEGQAGATSTNALWTKAFLDDKDDKKVVVGGYVETEFHDDFAGESYFDQHRMIVFLYAQPHDRISFATEIEWEHGGSPRKSNGELVAGEVLLEFAVLDFRITDWLQARSGIVLVPVGGYNINHDSPVQDITTRPLVATNVAPSTWFETGAGFFGQIPLGDTQRIDYQAYVINGFDTKIYDGLGMRAARGSLGEDNNTNKAMVGRASWTPMLGLTVAGSGYRGAYDPASERFVKLAAFDIAARWRWLEFQGETTRAWVDPGFDEGWTYATREPVPEDMVGFYAQLNAHFFPGWLTKAMPDDLKESTFTASLRYEEVDTDKAAITHGDQTRIIPALNYRPIEAFVIKNELLIDSNGATGTLARPWSPDYEPSIGYVGSANLLF
jgi:hypothetical protein